MYEHTLTDSNFILGFTYEIFNTRGSNETGSEQKNLPVKTWLFITRLVINSRIAFNYKKKLTYRPWWYINIMFIFKKEKKKKI